MVIAVTGAAGMLGSSVVARLVADGVEVVGLDLREPAPGTAPPDYRHLIGDVRDSAALRQALTGADAVVHCAAALPSYPAAQIRSIVVDGSRAVLDAVRAAFGEPAPVSVARGDIETWRETFRTTQGFEAWRNHGDWIVRHRPKMMEAVRGRFEAARQVSSTEYRVEAAKRAEVRKRVREVLGDDGILVLPTVPTAAPLRWADPVDLEAFRGRALCMLCMAGLAGVPQISLPLAKVHDAPLGLSLIGPAGRDRALIAAAKRLFV